MQPSLSLHLVGFNRSLRDKLLLDYNMPNEGVRIICNIRLLTSGNPPASRANPTQLGQRPCPPPPPLTPPPF